MTVGARQRFNSLVVGLLSWGAVSACGGRTTVDPFLISPDDFRTEIHTLVVAPVTAPEDLEISEDALVVMDSLIREEIDTIGFVTAGAEAYSETWVPILERFGGFYDPITGGRNEARHREAQMQLYDELAATFGADAVLYPELWLVDAPFEGGVARWDGTSEDVRVLAGQVLDWVSTIAAALASLNADQENPAGSVSALSLGIVIESIEGAEIYSHAGGIQVLEKMRWNERDWQQVSPEELLADRDRLKRAVRLVLRPLRDARLAAQ